MADIDTLGALTDEDVRFVETSCIITVGRLETLIDVSLQVHHSFINSFATYLVLLSNL